MSLINKLQNNGSVLSANNGATPSIPDFDLSKLHDTYSKKPCNRFKIYRG